jgi:hypothetical protein
VGICHVPIARDFDLGGMRAKELNVRVSVVEKKGDNEPPGFPLALELKQLALETTLFVGRDAVRRCGVV